MAAEKALRNRHLNPRVAPAIESETGLHILHLSLAGCLRAPPIRFGVTADTGGHIAYVLDAAAAQAQRADVARVTIVTRRFEMPQVDPVHAVPLERLSPKLDIRRIGDTEPRYLDKADLVDRLDELSESLATLIGSLSPPVDIIHAHFADAASIAGQMSKRLSIPFVYTPHSLGIDKARCTAGVSATPDSRISQEREAIDTAAGIIVSSQDEAERQVPNYGIVTDGKLHVIAPGAPVAAAGHAADGFAFLSPWLDDVARPIVLAVARPVRRKNLAALAEAFAGSAELNFRANLVIVAGDHLSPELSSEEGAVLDELRVWTHELQGRIALPPRHDRSVLQSLYAAAAVSGGVFVNPALHEPFGLTLLEAASCGLPVVATRHGGPVDIVARIGHGILIDPRHPDEIAAACLSLIEDPAWHARHAEAGRRNIVRFGWDAYAQFSMRVYRRLCLQREPVTGGQTQNAARYVWAS